MATPIVVPDGVALQTIELVSTLRAAPQNGAANSANYFSSQQENLIDLTTIESFVNNILLPMLNSLPSQAADGIEGMSIYFDTTSQDPLSYNSVSSSYLTIGESVRVLYGMIQNLQIAEQDDALNIASLQQRLSSSDQSDISIALQAMTAQLQAQAGTINNLQQVISSLQQMVGTSSAAAVATPAIAAGGIETVDIEWSTAFADNTYTVSYSLQDDSGYLRITGFSYLEDGTGIIVRVQNTDTSASHQGTVNALGLIA